MEDSNSGPVCLSQQAENVQEKRQELTKMSACKKFRFNAQVLTFTLISVQAHENMAGSFHSSAQNKPCLSVSGVAFHIEKSVGSLPAVRECVRDVPHVPLVVIEGLQDLNPLVCNGHLQSVVEAHTALLPRPAECWHAAHVLTYCTAWIQGCSICFLTKHS